MGGRGLTQSKMYYGKMWKPAELEHGEAIPKPEFKFCVITGIGHKDYKKELSDALNLDNFEPLVVVTAD